MHAEIPPPPTGKADPLPPPPCAVHAARYGQRYASYWNAILVMLCSHCFFFDCFLVDFVQLSDSKLKHYRTTIDFKIFPEFR